MGKEDFIQVRKTLGVLNLLIIFVACMVLSGWLFDIVLFKSILPSFSPMNPLTALLFLLSGISLFLLNSKDAPAQYRAGKLLAIVIILIALTRLVGFIVGYDIKIDRILFTKKLATNRMVLHTAINFLLVGLSLFFMDKRKSLLVPSQIFASVAFLISLLTIMGYVYAPGTLNKVAVQIPMAIHTACTFMLLTLALVLSRYQDGFVSVIMQKNIGGAIFRKLLYISVVLPFMVAILRYSEGKADLSKTEFGTPLLVISIVVITFFLIWLIARKLNQADKKRQEGYAELISLKNELADNETKYRNLVDNAGVMMYTVTLRGIVTFASNKSYDVTGYTASEFTGMHYSQCIDKDYYSEVKENHSRQVLNARKETTIEFCIITKNGESKWIEQTTVLLFENDIPSGFHCIAKDITETKEMQEILKKYELQLVQNQERLQSILDNASSMIYIKDLEGKYILTNKRFKEFYDLKDDALLGRTDFDIASMVQAQRFKDTDARVLTTGKPVELEEIIDTGFGKFNMLIVKFPLLDVQGKIYGISGIATDITERAKDREQLIQARQVAEDAKKMQEQFLANMSHEIRTPMNGIQGMTNLLLETELNEEQKDFAKTIKKSSDNLVVIINDILDFSKITAGKLNIEEIDFNLDEVIHNIRAVFRHRIKDKGLTLQMNMNENVPAILNGDPYRLNQVLVNLVGNAIKFTQSGSIIIDISVAGTSFKKTVLNFSITDTGIGIKPDRLIDIFESFTQGSIETSRKYGGTGLGLAITKQLLELQNGTIAVKSQINCGTTFEFSIPYNHNISNTPVFFAGENLKNYKTLFTGKKFLVAEDNEINQKVIRQVLQKAGGIVDIANNGLEAIALLKENKNYHLIIMDLQMPEMDGYAATKYIRNVMQLSIPIVAMTASALKDEKLKCMEIGMNDYLTKPFNFSFIYKRINLLLNETNANTVVPAEHKMVSEALFDLSILEEMDDDEYVEEILTLFLNNTPTELLALKAAAEEDEAGNIYTIAHKLKSSVGLLKANALLQLITQIEDIARTGSTEEISGLVESAFRAYEKIEGPLQKHLQSTSENLKMTI
ncbi:MAG: PAS domain S-box protein [Ferruginibacter sp.]